MKEKEEIVLKRDQPMRVPTKLRRHSTSMPIEATLSSLTSTCLLTIHQHSGTMRTSHMEEGHNKSKTWTEFAAISCLLRVTITITIAAANKIKNRKSGAEEI